MTIDYQEIIKDELNGSAASHHNYESFSISLESIEKEDLKEICLKLICFYILNDKRLDSEVAAKFVERLILSEVSAGGPYISTNEARPQLDTNIAIYRLLSLLDVRMPKLKSYIDDATLSNKHISNESKLLLSWEYAIDIKNPSEKIDKISDRIESYLLDNNLFNEFSEKLFKGLKKVDSKGEVTKFSKHFSNSLITTNQISKGVCDEYGEANFYAWMSFSIYDDFIDNEGVISLLPIANILHRKSFNIFLRSSKNSDETDAIHTYFDGVDKANLNETLNCRFKIDGNNIVISELPDYKNVLDISNRSIGHILGPVLIAKRENIDKKHLDLMIHALRSYLAARQLNDDAHDWKDDLRNGHISYAVAYLLSKSNIKPGIHETKTVIKELQNVFWDQGLEYLANQVIQLIDDSLSKMNKSTVFKKDPVIYDLYFKPIKDSAIKSKLILEDRKKFIGSINLKTANP